MLRLLRDDEIPRISDLDDICNTLNIETRGGAEDGKMAYCAAAFPSGQIS